MTARHLLRPDWMRMIRPLAARIPTFKFDADEVTFTPGMAKRATSVFATAPIVQGKFNLGAASVGDTIYSNASPYGGGPLFGNPTEFVRQTIDPYQGSIVFWITPEWDAVGSGIHYVFAASNSIRLYFNGGWIAFGVYFDGSWHDIALNASMAAATRKFIVCRWDIKNTLDGTNSLCVSLNDVHTFDITATGAPSDLASFNIGGIGAAYSADALIQGLTVYRRPLYDGTYGVPGTFDASGPVDEIAAIHALGNGQDPCLVTGSWDVVFCLPTNATEGALVTGTGEAWSHPHSSDVLDHWTLEDAFYGGGQWAVGFNGSSTYINCGSAAALDDLPNGAILTVDGWFRCDDPDNRQVIINKSSTANGWRVIIYETTGYVTLNVQLATTDAEGFGPTRNYADGKWHHFAGYYNDATKTARMAVDGEWGAANVGAGAYQADAVYDLYFGRRSEIGVLYFNGTIGWVRLSNNDRHTAGTDFIPPREFPAADGNTVEAWSLNDGTGATAVAQVTSPGNDGTIANGTWEQQWDDVGTPVYPTSLEGSTTTMINCGSGATIDDLPTGANGFTAEAWVRPDLTTGYPRVFSKDDVTTGWYMYIYGNQWAVGVRYPGTNTIAYGNVANGDDSIWHHVAMTYDENGDRRVRMWVDGILTGTGAPSAGVYATDAALTLYLMCFNGASNTWRGNVGWLRISDTVRYAQNFVPPDRANPPGIDGNTMAQWNMSEGAGTTASDSSGNANHGTITMGSGRWWNSPDMVSDSPGGRVYPWGYAIGSDGAGDGVHQHQAGLSAGENYVANVRLRYEADKRAQPRIEVYDETNGASISQFDGPFLTGTHDGGAAQASLSDSSAPYWPYSLVGGTVYNITNGESATITAAGNSIVGALSGSETWDNGDVYFIVPPDGWLFAEPFCFELPTIARNGAAADCTEISFRLLNQAGEGVVYWLQAEVLENLVDNPSLETGAGNPWIPDGWVNVGLDPGDSQASSAGGGIIHSGVDCVQANAGMVNENLQFSYTVTIAKYYTMGGWGYGDGAINAYYRSFAGILPYHSKLVDQPTYIQLNTGTYWRHTPTVRRSLGTGDAIIVLRGAGQNPAYIDDLYLIQLNDVSLTATPASEANSLETSGLRVDGRDSCVSNPGNLKAARGKVRASITPRHDAAELAAFAGSSGLPYLIVISGDVNNIVTVRVTAANTIRFSVTAGGSNDYTDWNCAGAIVAETTYLMEVRWSKSTFSFFVDGVLKAQVSPGELTVDPSVVYWGCDGTPSHQADAVYG